MSGGVVAVVRAHGQEWRVSTSPWAHVVYERQYHRSLASWETDPPPMEHVYYLVHAQLRLLDPGVEADFDRWLQQVDDVEMVEEPDPTGPPSAAPPSDTSSS